MKKQLLLPVVALLGLGYTKAQPLSNYPDDHALAMTGSSPTHVHARKNLIPDDGNAGFQVRAAFFSDFREATDARWTPGKTMDRVDFILGGKNLSAYYDQQANLIGTTSQSSWADLPERARKEITMKYPGFTARDVIFFEDNTYNESDMTLYDIRFDDADNYFVQLSDGKKEMILQVSPEGNVGVFREPR